MVAGSNHLDGVNDEVLIQHRLAHSLRHGGHISQVAVKTVGFGQYADGGGHGCISLGQGGRAVTVRDDCAQGGAGGLTFHDQGRAAGARVQLAILTQSAGAQGSLKRTLRTLHGSGL